MAAIKRMMSDFHGYDQDIIHDFKYNLYANFDKFCEKFNELVKNVGMTEEIHYFRLKLNKASERLEYLLTEKNQWEMLPYYKAAFHMNGKKGEYNLKFVSTGDQQFEAVYNKNGDLLTEENDPINMGTYKR